MRPADLQEPPDDRHCPSLHPRPGPRPTCRPKARDHQMAASSGSNSRRLRAPESTQLNCIIGCVTAREIQSGIVGRALGAVDTRRGYPSLRSLSPSLIGTQSIVRPCRSMPASGTISRCAGFAKPELYEVLRARPSASPSCCRTIRSCRSGSAMCGPDPSVVHRRRRRCSSPATAAGCRAGRDRAGSSLRSSAQGELYPRVGFIVTNRKRPAERISPTSCAPLP